ncbi:indole-3-glycerol phosphate synthase TrpC [Bacillus sp. JJ1764]|uniref:indole-3-glycerol phosphate synthase TrpC n=1 Tax=Bacillus sp. JJ1764 TaxID=3122964 RepID=UPI002FFE0447
MATILERIIKQKKLEIQNLQETGMHFDHDRHQKRPFIDKLQSAKELTIIAEFKRASPSKGIINNQSMPSIQAIQYEKFGAGAISVLTDQTFFKGSFSDLKEVREAVQLPVLCKDFIIDPIQIDQADSFGADIILLIVAALEKEQLKELYQYAANRGLDVLVEVHNEAELETAISIGAKLIGVNNRNLKTFHVSLEVTESLAAKVKNAGAFLISESGIHHQEDVKRVIHAGANGILVGEAFMRSQNMKQMFSDFRLPLGQGVKR